MVFTKTIIQVYSNPQSIVFGEFIRGTLYLIDYANKNGLNVRLNIQNTELLQYVIVDNYNIHGAIPTVYNDYEIIPSPPHMSSGGEHSINRLENDLFKFKNSGYPILVITTNAHIDPRKLTKESIILFNKLIRFTPLIYELYQTRLSNDILNRNFNPASRNNYNVIYLYISQEQDVFNYTNILYFANKIRTTVNLTKNTVIICNYIKIKNQLTTLLRYCNSSPVEDLLFAEVSDLQHSILDFMIACGATIIYNYSEYDMGIRYNPRIELNNELLSYTVEPSDEYIITTIAGSPNIMYGHSDGPVNNSSFNYPNGVTSDASGNIYVADTNNNEIRKITNTGEVITIAGLLNQTSGDVNGLSRDASFYGPTSIVVDSSGSIYVLDIGNSQIRKISPDGIVSTFAGSNGGYIDDVGTAAKFRFTFNQLFITTTFAGSFSELYGHSDGYGVNSSFNYPNGVTSDASGNIYVADTNNNTIRKITNAGEVTTVAGSLNQVSGSINGVGRNASFYGPTSVVVDSSGSIYLVDIGNSQIRKISPDGIVTTVAGNTNGYTDSIGTAAQFKFVFS